VKVGITLVLGGARSGKSEVAERLAVGFGPPTTYVATGWAPSGDAEWAQRVQRHRERRPPEWLTVEVEPAGDLGSLLESITGGVLLDSVGTWLAGLADLGAGGAEGIALREGLVARRSAGHPTIVVSEEVGLGVHPSSSSGRIFRDAIGTLNRQIADVADSVLLVVAGRVMALNEPTAP
jgi:adenosylcobinamide kinase / adenosylcobinamide-phosphate guanylyltransferase